MSSCWFHMLFLYRFSIPHLHFLYMVSKDPSSFLGLCYTCQGTAEGSSFPGNLDLTRNRASRAGNAPAGAMSHSTSAVQVKCAGSGMINRKCRVSGKFMEMRQVWGKARRATHQSGSDTVPWSAPWPGSSEVKLGIHSKGHSSDQQNPQLRVSWRPRAELK